MTLIDGEACVISLLDLGWPVRHCPQRNFASPPEMPSNLYMVIYMQRHKSVNNLFK